MPHLSPTTLTSDEQRLIVRATAGNLRDHTIISVALALACAWPKSSASTSATRSRWTGRHRCG